MNQIVPEELNVKDFILQNDAKEVKFVTFQKISKLTSSLESIEYNYNKNQIYLPPETNVKNTLNPYKFLLH